MTQPYERLPSHRFWSSAVTAVAPHELDPIVDFPLRIGKRDRVSTIGSCFAQHLSRFLRRSGMRYFVAELPPERMSKEEAKERTYGVFSARYGNVYTVRQAVQLFDRAFGAFEPVEEAWWRVDGRVVDPLRPRVEPGGFEDLDALRRDRAVHLAAVRRVFLESNVLVFTLGLTEAWVDTRDGTVLPLAPGVAAGRFEHSRHAFVNFTVSEVTADLVAFAERIQGVNPKGHILLTVSPVPLVATYEPRHVLVSTVHSKSILRVAAAEAEARLPCVHYFPAYEIVTAPGLADRYFADDLRQVTAAGVAHVMRVFARHCFPGAKTEPPSAQATGGIELQHRLLEELFCDELELEPAR